MSALPPAIFLMGPTASGKTDLALALADELPCELISVDSALIYRGMDIGTAKPDKQTLADYPHHLVDILDPAQSYSAAEFVSDTRALMAQATAAGKIPLLVGGTMLYYKALLEGMADLPEANAAVRERLEALGKAEGWAALHAQLQAVDPESAARIHPNDPQRLVRALEVFEVSGETLTTHRLRQQQNQAVGAHGNSHLPYTVARLCIMPAERSILHQRIEQRFKVMIRHGFVEEVEALMQRPDLHAALPSMRAVGYRQVWEYLDGQLSYDEMIERGIIATRQLAKRQVTWLRGWDELYSLDSLSGDNLSQTLQYLHSLSILS